MINESDLNEGAPRLLTVDNPLFLPIKRQILLLVTSVDVLHSFSVPSLGVKTDACPGRLNAVVLTIFREGIFFGQCSELCGVNHAFMPITVESLIIEEDPIFLISEEDLISRLIEVEEARGSKPVIDKPQTKEVPSSNEIDDDQLQEVIYTRIPSTWYGNDITK